MPDSSKKRQRFTPLQLVLVLILILGTGLYEVWSQPARQAPPAPTPVLRLTPAATEPQAAPTKLPAPTPAWGDFDYFVLALSWSPDYCATTGQDDLQECPVGKNLGFVLHGLWPQYTSGYPSSCSTQKLSQAVKAQFPGLYPNDSLYAHEWEKHGTCAGVPAQEYLAAALELKQAVVIPAKFLSPQAPFRISPDHLRQDFIQANPGFLETSLAVNCSDSGRYLKELYVCFSKEGRPAACGTDVHKDALKSCRQSDFLVRTR
jgi:ribonuclease T2